MLGSQRPPPERPTSYMRAGADAELGRSWRRSTNLANTDSSVRRRSATLRAGVGQKQPYQVGQPSIRLSFSVSLFLQPGSG